jgi:hypothetical protein
MRHIFGPFQGNFFTPNGIFKHHHQHRTEAHQLAKAVRDSLDKEDKT